MATDNDPNVQIESGGATFMVATDALPFQGTTAHFQYMKVAYGPTGSVSVVSSSNPFPVNVVAGGITANLIGFCGAVQGIIGGTPVTVDGTVYTVGVSSAPVFVRTNSGYQVEVTGGRQLKKSTDNISVYGPNGITWVYTNIVDASGTAFGNSANPFYVSIMGATINAVVNPTVGVTNSNLTPLFITGVTGTTPVPVNVGNTVGINDTKLLSSLGGICSGIDTLNLGLGTTIPGGFKTGRVSVGSSSVVQMDTGFTCGYGVNLKSINANTNLIYVGNTLGFVGGSSGYSLYEGETVFLKVSNTNSIYLISGSGTQVLTFIAS